MRYKINTIELWISKKGTRGVFYQNDRKFSSRVKEKMPIDDSVKILLNEARATIFHNDTGKDPLKLSKEEFTEYLRNYKVYQI